MRSSMPVHIAAKLLLIFLFTIRFPCARAVDLDACGARLLQQQNTAQNMTDTMGYGLNISYEECLAECGSGLGNVDWQSFSQNFGAWLLPWIALMFQIPFGAERPWDDIVSFFLTVGCPALSAYSLQITHLNKCWITAAFMDVEYPNSEHMATILAAFHHIPIQIEYRPPFLHSLIALRDNDKFWFQLATANKTRRWSIPLIMTYVLVIFALLLSVADSLSSHPADIGYGISAIWVVLLPLIIGWLHIGCEPEPGHLRKSLAAANKNAWVATEDRDLPVKMTRPKGIEFAKASVDEEADDPEAGGVDLARNDELKPVPVFNYSRAFVTPMTAQVILRLVKNAAANAQQEITVSGPGEVGEVPERGQNEEGKVSPQNRVRTIAEVVQCCDTGVFRQPQQNSGSITLLGSQSPNTTESTYPPLERGMIIPPRWAPGIWKRVAIASTLALGLQWGTVGAAMFVHYLSPPIGLGCRASSFLLYGVATTSSFFLFLASSILAHMSRPLPGRVPTRSWLRTCQGAGAIVCRWLGKSVAFASAMGITLVCFFQVTNVFNDCYCLSTTLDMGRTFVVFVGFDAPATRPVRLWITGLAIAFASAMFFGFSMYAGLPPQRDE